MIADWAGMLPISGEVVVVEDNDVLRQLMADILMGMRAKVVLFERADDALMHVLDSHRHCSLLLAEHGVPGQILGLQLARMFRSKWPKIPVILTSGYEQESSDLPEGVVFLIKPWPVGKLVQTIASLLQPGIVPIPV
ncbi:response regulator [Pseudomonas putida]|uniref:response regulator n=1 Tax=Pseudomonas putida TaxID=303 RepID=UPI002363B385|nr:response regulator [Pseudomonas putida]MDD1965895.1 response regulator [Pseudomonas putida]